MSNFDRVVKPGDEIYVPTKWYVDRGQDDIQGGLATIEAIEPDRGWSTTWVRFKELPGRSFNLNVLLQQQEELEAEFGDRRAYPDPDPGF